MNRLHNKFLIGQRFLFDPYDNSLIDQDDANELTRLGSNESRALSLLIEEPGAIITRTRLHNHVWREQGFEVDDSSLTQAISTLRKALKDSTKSPAFIKTIPKRGYLMIADVQVVNHAVNIEPSTLASEPDTVAEPPLVSEQPLPLALKTTPQATPQHPYQQRHSALSGQPKKRLFAILSGFACLIALLIPIFVNTCPPPVSSAFRPLMDVDGIPVMTPTSQPDLSPWKGIIAQCIESYAKHHIDEKRPIEVIVSGEMDQLWLNYVHSSYTPTENVTLRLLTSQKDHTTLCQ